MKTIAQKIAEVQQYFKDKLLAGEFEFNGILDNYFSKVTIDGEYSFHIWTGNIGIDNSTFPMTGIVSIPFVEQDRITLHSRIKPLYEAYQRDQLRAKLKADLDKLESEIESHKNNSNE